MSPLDFNDNDRLIPKDNRLIKELETEEMEIESLTQKHEKSLYMLRAVKTTLLTNSDIVTTMPQLTLAIDKLNEYVDRINKNPPETRNNLIQVLSKISGGLRNLAVMAENSDLIEETSWHEDNLRDLNDLELIKISKSIYESANMFLNSLSSFGIHENMIVNLEYVIEDFCCSISSQNSSFSRESLIQEEQDRLFEEALHLLSDNIDNHIESIRNVYPRFYNEYRASRILGGTRPENRNAKQTSRWL